ncbi:MAG TPA: class I SAM-dependent methyltransferase [Rhodopila sp.]|nr:class I SAM-dependent methyltransferase [Rhodopila sp.]
MSDVLFPGRFRDLAEYYASGRPTYPRLLAQRVADLIGLDGSGRVLDLGTGPGFLALDFHPFASEVLALDPEPAMLRVAQANAERAGKTMAFIQGSAADLGPQFGPLFLVTIGRAFHWMDRPKTLTALDELAERGGAVALFQESYPVVPVNDWQPSFQAILDHYGAEDPARDRTHNNKDHEAVLLASPFSHLERVSVLEPRLANVEHFVDRALSFARAWQGRPGSRLKDMALEVRGALSSYARDGMVAEVVEGTALIARRPSEVS